MKKCTGWRNLLAVHITAVGKADTAPCGNFVVSEIDPTILRSRPNRKFVNVMQTAMYGYMR